MSPAISLEELAERTIFLLQEMSITSGVLYDSLLPLMEGIRSGRSPQSLEFEQLLISPREYLGALQEIFSEFEQSLARFNQVNQEIRGSEKQPKEPGGLLGKIPQLKSEQIFYREFQEMTSGLIKKLILIQNEDRLSALGKMPLEDAWEEVEAMAKKT